MRALSQSRFLRFLTFGALYFAQGVPWGFIATGYVVFMADQGLSNDAVGSAIGLAYLPWSFKVLWGPLIDRFPSLRFGRRRPYIIAAELLMGLSLVVLALIGDLKSQLKLVSAILLLHNVCASVQDVAVDALAVDLLPADERGRANSVMWAAKSAGVAIGGGGGVYLAKLTSWPTLMISMAVVIWLIMLLPLFVRERPEGASADSAQIRLDVRELWRSFNFPAPAVTIAIALLTPVGYAMVPPFMTRMYRADLHFGEAQIASLAGIVEPITGVVAAFVGGFLADRMGARRTMAAGMVICALSLASFGLTRPYWASYPFVFGWTVAFNFGVYMYNASSLGFYMTMSNPAIGATQFTLYMAATNLCYSATSKLGGWAADTLGYERTFFCAAAFQLVTVALLPLCNVAAAEKRFHGPRDASTPQAAPGALPDPGV